MKSLILENKKSGLEPKAKHRAPLACLACRSRKVRCDVAKHGQPCMNCKLDDRECVVTKRASSRAGTHHRKHGEQDLVTPDAEAPRTPARPRSTTRDKIAFSLFEADLSCKDANANHALDGLIAKGLAEDPHPKPWEVDCLRTPPTFSLEPGHLMSDHQKSGNMIWYCSYPFVRISNLFYESAEDIHYLELQGCFQLPSRPVISEFLLQYFLHVHPLLPMLSEADFWESFANPSPPESKRVSLFLLQSILFASCAFLPEEVISYLGYSNTRSVRASFYKKSKLLYDFGIEECPVAKAQAALLLTFWTPSLKADARHNSQWLSISIENARIAQADLYSDTAYSADRELEGKRTLRRLWWCCVIRDRILPLGLRRAIQITPNQFDFGKNIESGSIELQHEVRRSRVYNETTREGLARVVDSLVKLSVALTDVLLLAFPLKRGGTHPVFSGNALQKAKRALIHWSRETPVHECRGSSDAIPESIILFDNLLRTYYHCATIVLYYYDIRKAENRLRQAGQQARINKARENVWHSTASIADCLGRLNTLQLTRGLPISIVAYVAFPLALFIVNSQRSEWPTGLGITHRNRQDEVNAKRLDTLVKVIKSSYERYDGVEGVVRTVRTVIDHIKRQHVLGPSSPANDGIELADNQLSWDLRLSIAIDWGLSNGKTSAYQGFNLELQQLLGYDRLPLLSPPTLPSTFEPRLVRHHQSTPEDIECTLLGDMPDSNLPAMRDTSDGKEGEVVSGPDGIDTNEDHGSATEALDLVCPRALWFRGTDSMGSSDGAIIEDNASECITKTMSEPFDLLPSFDEKMSKILDLPTGEDWETL